MQVVRATGDQLVAFRRDLDRNLAGRPLHHLRVRPLLASYQSVGTSSTSRLRCHISTSQVSELAKHLDGQAEAFRSRPLDAGPYRFGQADALTMKVREAGRVINMHRLLAVGVNGGGRREILGLDVVSSEDGAGWLAFFRGLVARACPACAW